MDVTPNAELVITLVFAALVQFSLSVLVIFLGVKRAIRSSLRDPAVRLEVLSLVDLIRDTNPD